MDMESGKKQLISSIKKYQYVFAVVLIGVVLMLIPQREEEQEVQIYEQELVASDLAMELTEILTQISGVGKAKVLLTEAAGSESIYQVDTGKTFEDQNTVIVVDGNRVEKGLIRQVLPPVYKGAVIICQGADSATVRLSVIEAVKSVTGLSSDRICVLKMK